MARRLSAFLLAIALWVALPPPLAATGEIAAPLFSLQVPVAAHFETIWRWQIDGKPIAAIALDVHLSGIVCGIEARRRGLFLADSLGQNVRLAAPAGGGVPRTFATRVFAGAGLQIFTLDSWSSVIEAFDLDGERQEQIDLAQAVADAGEDLGELVDFCLDRSGDLFALDATRGRVFHFDREGALIDVLGETGDISFEAPIALEVDGRGRLFLLETCPASLIVLDADGRLIRRGFAIEVDPSRVDAVALAVDLWGNAFVADAASGDILVVPEGETPEWWIRFPDEGRTRASADLALAGTNRLLVSDAREERVWVFKLRYRSAAPAPGATGNTGPVRNTRDSGNAR
jgi:hypothetical protein